MVGKLGHIQVSKLLLRGIIADFEVTEKLLRYFLKKCMRTRRFHSATEGRHLRAARRDGSGAQSCGRRRKRAGAAVLRSSRRRVGHRRRHADPRAAGNMIINIGAGSTRRRDFAKQS